MERTIRWGILGTGGIAQKFTRDLRLLPQAEVAAVGSRTQDRAEAFGRENGPIARCHGSYEALAADPGVDVIYVATPHPFHHRDTLLCLEAGKHVLCEKPFALNAREAAEMAAAARRNKRFLMEGMWTRFLPMTVAVRKMMAEKTIGELRLFEANFGFSVGDNLTGRHLNPALGGGALLDVGVYVTSYAHMLFGPPEKIAGHALIGETGVDEQAGILLGFPRGRFALLTSAVRTRIGQEAALYGAAGIIRMNPFWSGYKMTLSVTGQPDQLLEFPFQGTGMNCEAAEVMRCIADGRTESDILPLDETLRVMQTLDTLRAQWGLTYPMETL